MKKRIVPILLCAVIFCLPLFAVAVSAAEISPPSQEYTVTVNAGPGAAGAGQYKPGDIVTVTADLSLEEKNYITWSADPSLSFSSKDRTTATFVMPDGPVTVTANLKAVDYIQAYDPFGNAALSTIVAALPVLVLLYLLAIHPHKNKKTGKTELGIFAPYAAIAAALVAIVIALFICKMPALAVGSAFVYGVLYGVFSIGWIVFGAIFLYNTTLITGKFEILRDSVAGLTPDRRLQALLIAFSFGAFIEGACGFGTPVAVSGAIMCGLGFRPITAAVICLIANTAPVAWGAVGTPIITLAGASGIPEELITRMAGHQLPFFSVIIPIWLVATLVVMDKGKLSDVIEVLPGCLVCGLSFAITQFSMAEAGNVMLVDIGAGIVSLIVTALFFRI
ncbi:MAG: L-lactate permease, partial [Gracilibacteraceae bacterium]|nr:L-lactate permease [Gracilibacteraceae bacterium]